MLQLGFFLLSVVFSWVGQQVVLGFSGVCVEPFPEGFDVGECVFHVEVSHLCAPECGEVCAGL